MASASKGLGAFVGVRGLLLDSEFELFNARISMFEPVEREDFGLSTGEFAR